MLRILSLLSGNKGTKMCIAYCSYWKASNKLLIFYFSSPFCSCSEIANHVKGLNCGQLDLLLKILCTLWFLTRTD